MIIILISEVKPIGKIGKKILENEDSNSIIEKIIEKPLQNACKLCKEKNIETVMSSANKNNIAKTSKEIVDKNKIMQILEKSKLQNFEQAGKGYAWIMINYATLSDENKEVLFSLENELGEDVIWFVKSSYVDTMNFIRRKIGLKEIKEIFDDKYAKEFEKRQIKLAYNNKYPRRTIFIRMPINSKTTVDEVEKYFETIISKIVKQ